MERLKSMKETLMSCAQGQMGNLGQVDAQELGAVVDMIKDLDEAIYYCSVVKAMEESKEEKKYAQMMQSSQQQQPIETHEHHYYTIPYYSQMMPYDNYRDWEYEDGRMYYSEGGGSGRGGGRRGYEGGDSGSTNSSGNGNQGRSGYSSGSSSSSGGSNSSSGGRSSGGNNARGGGTRGYDEYPLMYEYPREIRDYREGKSPMSRRGYMESKENHQGKEKQMQELEKYLTELAQDVTEMVQDASPEEKQMLQQKLSTLATKMK